MFLITGPETLLRQSSTLVNDVRGDSFYGGGDNGDAIEAHEWKCVRTINGKLGGNLYSFDIKQLALTNYSSAEPKMRSFLWFPCFLIHYFQLNLFLYMVCRC